MGNESAWKSPYSKLPSATYKMAIGYDKYNQNIWLLGGSQMRFEKSLWLFGEYQYIPGDYDRVRRQKISFNVNQWDFTLYDNENEIYGDFRQSYTQKDDILYCHSNFHSMISTFNLTSQKWKERDIAIPDGTSFGASCISHVDHYLIVSGGSRRRLSKRIYIYDIDSNEWILNAPNMNEMREFHSCAVVNQYLFQIGGSDCSEYISFFYLNSVEKLFVGDIQNIDKQSWETFEDKLSMFNTMGLRSVVYDKYIYVIDEKIDVIDTTTDSISLYGELKIPVTHIAPIIIGQRIYVFGGLGIVGGWQNSLDCWQYHDLLINEEIDSCISVQGVSDVMNQSVFDEFISNILEHMVSIISLTIGGLIIICIYCFKRSRNIEDILSEVERENEYKDDDDYDLNNEINTAEPPINLNNNDNLMQSEHHSIMDSTNYQLNDDTDAIEQKQEFKQNQATENKVISWLRNEVNLPQYIDIFTENGFDDMRVITKMNENDLNEIGISKLGHRKRILICVEELQHNQQSAENEGDSTHYI